MRIHEAAAMVGITPRAIRFYEEARCGAPWRLSDPWRSQPAPAGKIPHETGRIPPSAPFVRFYLPESGHFPHSEGFQVS